MLEERIGEMTMNLMEKMEENNSLTNKLRSMGSNTLNAKGSPSTNQGVGSAPSSPALPTKEQQQWKIQYEKVIGYMDICLINKLRMGLK